MKTYTCRCQSIPLLTRSLVVCFVFPEWQFSQEVFEMLMTNKTTKNMTISGSEDNHWSMNYLKYIATNSLHQLRSSSRTLSGTSAIILQGRHMQWVGIRVRTNLSSPSQVSFTRNVVCSLSWQHWQCLSMILMFVGDILEYDVQEPRQPHDGILFIWQFGYEIWCTKGVLRQPHDDCTTKTVSTIAVMIKMFLVSRMAVIDCNVETIAQIWRRFSSTTSRTWGKTKQKSKYQIIVSNNTWVFRINVQS